MALADNSFKLYEESGLITLVSTLETLIHKTDLSDGNQDFQLFLGSVIAGRKIDDAVYFIS